MSRTIDHNTGKRHVQKAWDLAGRRSSEVEEIRKDIFCQLDDIADEKMDAGYLMYLDRIARNGEVGSDGFCYPWSSDQSY